MTHPDLSPAQLAAALHTFPPTDEQEAVISHRGGPLLVLAGAGSGKTQTIGQRVVYLVASGLVAPERVLGLTFTRKAAGELDSRIATMLSRLVDAGLVDEAAGAPTISTYNAYAARIVRDFGAGCGVDPDTRLIGDAERYQMMTQIVTDSDGIAGVDPAVSSFVSNALALSDQLANHGLAIDQTRRGFARYRDDLAEALGEKVTKEFTEVLDSLRMREGLMDYVAQFERAKRERHVMDFSDQIQLACRIVREDAGACRMLREEYDVIVLDEFQDTSAGQMRFLSALFHGKEVSAVGDPNQAIYAWRGASQAALQDFHRDFGGTETLTLSVAWRNDKTILAAANAIVDGGAGRPDYWRAQADPIRIDELRARPDAGNGRVFTGTFLTSDDESRALAAYLREHWYPHRESQTAAVLVRTRAMVVEIAGALQSAGLPVDYAGSALLDEPAVRDVIAALWASANAARGDMVMRLLVGCGIAPADIACLSRWSHHLAADPQGDEQAHAPALLLDAVETPPPIGWVGDGTTGAQAGFSARAAARVDALGDALRALRRASDDSLPRLVSLAIARLNIDIDAAANPLTPLAHRALDAFVALASRYEAEQPHATLIGFLTWLEYAESEERGLEGVAQPTQEGAVAVLTVHAAKGLEWDTVCVAGLSRGRFPTVGKGISALKAKGALLPHMRGDADYVPHLELSGFPRPSKAWTAYYEAEQQRHLSEERRLAYVAYTRARSVLVLTRAWLSGTRARVTAPSPFLEEVVHLGRPLPVPYDTAVRCPSDAELDQLLAQVRPATRWREPEAFEPLRLAALAVSHAADQLRDHGGADQHLNAVLALTAHAQAAENRLLADTARVLAEQRDRAVAHSVQIPGRLTTTTLAHLGEEGLEAYLERLRRPMPAEPIAGAQVGTHFHAWVAYVLRGLRWGGDYPTLAEAGLATLPDLSEGEADAMRRLIADFSATGILERYRPEQVEYDVAAPIGDRMLLARLDALMRDANGRYVIVDWKTDRPEGFAARRPAYEDQLRAYRYALALMRDIDPEQIDMVLVAVRERRLVPVEPSATFAADLEATIAQAVAAARDVHLS